MSILTLTLSLRTKCDMISCSFHPMTQRAREIVQSGELGKIKSITGEFALPGLLSPLFFEKKDVRFNYDLGGGAVMDLGGTSFPSLPHSPSKLMVIW